MTTNHPTPTPSTGAGIDPRSPRFGAGITAVLLLVSLFLALTTPLSSEPGGRAAEPAFLLLLVVALLFAWGAFAGIRRHPYGALFRRFVRPRLTAPDELEAPEPPTFAQGVGLVVVAVGLILHLVGVPGALVVSAAAAFVAAFLNSVFGYCLGCQLYLLLLRARLVGRRA